MSERIVALADLDDRGQLAALAERAFGKGSRSAGWLARKQHREHVDPTLSRVAIAGDPADEDAWRGYVLVGTPPSRAPAARTAGTAVDPRVHGRGLGTALVRSAAQACRARGFTALELWAEHDRVGFYERLGFTTELAFDTLVAFASGPHDAALPEPEPWDPDDATSRVQLHAFLPEAWARTPERCTIRDDDGLAHVAHEGVAFVVHRTLLATDVLASPARAIAWFDALVRTLPRAAPVCLVALDRVSSITRALHEHGWSVAQRGCVMTLPLAGQLVAPLR
ncbi:MAG TPA: GNAT family N-acetyltransferase [Nannocystaceae bacterium]|nr:GNAT family N-acetyltransferase [Nannocystaceae bacterium]